MEATRATKSPFIQVMLRVVTNGRGVPYLNANYTGVCDAPTKDAIASFQKDQKLIAIVPAPNAAAAAAPAGAARPAPKLAVIPNNEKEGFVSPQSKTYQLLVAGLPAQYAGIRAIPGIRTVFLEQSSIAAATSAHAVIGSAGLNRAFGGQVAGLIQAMYDLYKIALSVEPVNGFTRSFAEQNKLLTAPNPNTQAGPGESNHNWGFAVDIGFNGLKWLNGDASIVTDDYWLNRLSRVNNADFSAFWTKRNEVAVTRGLFTTRLKNDLIHLQNFDDSGVSMAHSLAAQLSRVGKFKWQFAHGAYQTDLGSGGKLEPVGNASQLWMKKSNPSKALIAAAKNTQEKTAWTKLSKDQKDKLNAAAVAKLPAGTKLQAGVEPGLKVWKEAEITNAMIEDARQTILDEMIAAEAKRDLWVPASS